MYDLIMIGEKFGLDELLYDEVVKSVRRQVGRLRFVGWHDEKDPIVLDVVASLHDMSAPTVIVCVGSSFATVSKMIATLIDDTLIHSQGRLYPSKALYSQNDSYTIEHNGYAINVVRYHKALGDVLLAPLDHQTTLHLFGYDAATAKILLGALGESSDVKLYGYDHCGGWSVVKVHASRYGSLEGFVKSAAQLFSGRLIEADDLWKHIVTRLSQYGKKITCAESCTGGMLASMLTSVAGSSRVFDGSMVTYANTMKHEWLQVGSSLLEDYGAVSEQVALRMAYGIRSETQADLALAITGIAGPDGGSEQKPVGTVYIALSDAQGEAICERLSLQGDRQTIRQTAIFQALRLLIEQKKEIFCIS